MNEDYYPKDGSASPRERAELQRIQQEGFARHLSVGTVRAYVLTPDGHTYDVVNTTSSTTTVESLSRAVRVFKPRAGGPVVPPRPQSVPPPGPTDGVTLHLVARGDDRGSWGEFPAESWIVLDRADWSRLLPVGQVSPGQTWSLAPEVTAKILTYFYPQTENNDARPDRIEQQCLSAKALAITDGVVTARVDGYVKMHHAFYPGRKDAQQLEAQVVGVLIFTPGQPPTLELATTQAIHGARPFTVAVRTIPHEPR